MGCIYIIDDSSLTRRMLNRILTDAGFITLEASNGKEALERLEDANPLCILLDLVMPIMDGFEVLLELKRRNNSIPVIVLTADIQDTTRQRCMEYGAKGLVNKPPKPEILLPVLQQVLAPA